MNCDKALVLYKIEMASYKARYNPFFTFYIFEGEKKIYVLNDLLNIVHFAICHD